MAETQIKITADTRDAERAIKDLDRALSGIEESAKTMAVALGVVTAASAVLTATILKTINAAGDIIDASDALGISASKLYELQQGAALAGVEAQTLNATIQRLSVNIGEGLATGTGAAVDAMKRLGLNINDIGMLRPDEQFQRIGQRLLEIENPAQRAAAAVDLFGKQGPQILKVVEELEKYRQVSESLGFGVSERDLVSLDEASDAVDQLRILWDAGVKKAIAEIAPYIVALVNKIKEAVAEAGGFDGIWKAIKSTLHTVANVIAITAALIAGKMVIGATAFAVQMIRAGNAAKVLQMALARTPVGLIALALGVAADKLGVDLVGGAGEFLDLNLDINAAQQQINTALDQKNAKLNSSNEIIAGYNKEQQKALDALDLTIAKLADAARFEKDKLEYGEVEARIRRTISEEAAKLEKVNLTLTQQQRDRIRNLILEEDSIKRQITNQLELNKAILGMMTAQTSAGREQEKLDNLLALRSGKTLKQIEDEKLAKIQSDKTFQFLAIQLQRTAVEEAIYLETNKFNKFAQLQYERELQLRKFQELELLIDKNNFATKTQMHKDLLDARARYDKQYQLQRIELEKQTAEELRRIELDRITRSMMNEKDLGRVILNEKDRQILQEAGELDRQKAIIEERIAFEKKNEMEKAAFAINQGAQMFSALGAQNRKAFEAAKAFNIANAIMNTYMAATKALATYPWPFGAIAAAAAVGMGLAQVAQIRSQQYSGRALGGPVMANKSYIVGESGPELFTPNNTGSITRNSDLGRGEPVNVTFNIMANDTAGFDDLLLSRKGLIRSVISDAMLESGRRG